MTPEIVDLIKYLANGVGSLLVLALLLRVFRR